MGAARGGTRIGGLSGSLVALALLAGCAAAPDASTAPPAAVPTAAPTSSAAAPTPSPGPAAGSAGSEGSDGEGERPSGVVSGEPRCAPAQLEGRIEQDGAAAGNRYATLVVTNTSNHTCTVYGYGGAELYTASGVPIPTRMERVLDPAPSLVRLLPGASAGKDLHWGVVPTGDEPVEGPCQVAASEIRVIPPDETSPFWVVWDQGPVCDGGRIEGSAYYPLAEPPG